MTRTASSLARTNARSALPRGSSDAPFAAATASSASPLTASHTALNAVVSSLAANLDSAIAKSLATLREASGFSASSPRARNARQVRSPIQVRACSAAKAGVEVEGREKTMHSRRAEANESRARRPPIERARDECAAQNDSNRRVNEAGGRGGEKGEGRVERRRRTVG